MQKRVIYHIDVNAAFLSWEAAYRIHHFGAKTDLRNEIAAVGGDMAMRYGIILAKLLPAKRYGIKPGESIMEARQKCPFLKLVPPNYTLYEACSKAFMEILREYTPDIEQYSIDEAFILCDRVIVVTNNYFTSSAIELAQSNDVILWNRDILKEKIKELM